MSNQDIVLSIDNLTKQVSELAGITQLLVEELQDLNFNMNTALMVEVVQNDAK